MTSAPPPKVSHAAPVQMRPSCPTDRLRPERRSADDSRPRWGRADRSRHGTDHVPRRPRRMPQRALLRTPYLTLLLTLTFICPRTARTANCTGCPNIFKHLPASHCLSSSQHLQLQLKKERSSSYAPLHPSLSSSVTTRPLPSLETTRLNSCHLASLRSDRLDRR